ncbi:Fic family protein, partial [Portibacter marinus]|uniref:hypothetical protein n=1 Tax=Portibacter marinus TaxID=2898660 RepID=UPI001F3011A6
EIEKRKKDYYKALMSGQSNRYTEKENIKEWVLFLLNTLHASIKTLEENYSNIKDKKSYLNERQTEVVNFITDNEPVKISDLTSALDQYTQYILKKDVKYLVDEGVINRAGKGKGTIYYVNLKGN